jgi:hypothetical protein
VRTVTEEVSMDAELDSPKAAVSRRRGGPELDDEGYRGMLLVEALASEWGVDPLDSGKIVWARLETSP